MVMTSRATVKAAMFLVANFWVTMIAAQNPVCDICNGRTLTNADKPIDTSMLPPELLGQIPAGLTLTCGLIAQAGTGRFFTTTQCTQVQAGIDLFCTCVSNTPVAPPV